MMDEMAGWDGLTPLEKMESPRGRYLIATALHYAVQQISRFPEERRADRDCDDMRTILNGCFPQYAAQFRQNDRRWDEIHKPKAVDLDTHRADDGEPDE